MLAGGRRAWWCSATSARGDGPERSGRSVARYLLDEAGGLTWVTGGAAMERPAGGGRDRRPGRRRARRSRACSPGGAPSCWPAPTWSIHDRLVARELLDLAPAGAELIDVGKAPGQSDRQADINALLVDHGRAGREVVRLKGGDPFVFGRGGEEAEALRRAGVGLRGGARRQLGLRRSGGGRHPGHPPGPVHLGDRGHRPRR